MDSGSAQSLLADDTIDEAAREKPYLRFHAIKIFVRDQDRSKRFYLEQLGFNTGHSETPITPVIVGEGALAMKFSNRLFQEGVFAQGIVYPTVPVDKCRVRTIVTAIHTRDELSKALGIFEKVGKELHII